MAHFAEIDENNVVLRVIVTDSSKPAEGHGWLIKTFGGTWVKTSYNTRGGVHQLGGEPYRKNFAGVGYTFDADRDAFIPPKPYESWILDEETCLWEPPIPYSGSIEVPKEWDEDSRSWLEVTN